MTTKLCKWCNTEKDLIEFYVHPMMKDGRLNKCSSCCKAEASARYVSANDRIKVYEKSRAKTKHRKEYCRSRLKQYRQQNPDKNKARRLVNYYVRTGKIIKTPCVICGDLKSEAHHDDYSRPLEIVWMCRYHHRLEEGRIRIPR